MRNTHRTDAPDTVWHVGSRVNWRMWHLETEEAFRVFVECLARSLARFGMDLLAFVLMSNHYHAIVRSPSGKDFRRLTGRRTRCRHYRPYPAWHEKSTVVGQCLQHFKIAVAKRLQSTLGLSGHFWEGKHFRKRVTNARTLIVMMAYDHRNPVREAMVVRPEDYPRSSAAWWRSGTPAPLPLCRRNDLPFGLTHEALRAEVLRFQRDKRVDDLMEAIAKSRLALDSVEGQRELDRMLAEAELEEPDGSEDGPAAAAAPA
ncbi:MAG: hypothetical protein L6Q95_08475 [Planctomycetes bacterium]|nr:hypothetical protein [Planctomycetota bacterium]